MLGLLWQKSINTLVSLKKPLGETESGEVDTNNGETVGVDKNDDYNINYAGDVDAIDGVWVNYSGGNYELLEVLVDIIQQATFTLY